MRFLLSEMETPIGALTLLVYEGVLRAVEFERHGDGPERLAKQLDGVELERRARIPGITDRMRAYFDGEIDALDAIPVEAGGTEFQRSVWKSLRLVRAGSTISYGDLARKIGRPQAVRAVGMANARNPIPVVIPCHRVLASDRTLHGYGGGLERKKWLLDHEGAQYRGADPLFKDGA